MQKIKKENPVTISKIRKQCLSCGTAEIIGRRRYCSIECRQQLFRRLKILIGLLRALRTKYAAFSFTKFSIVLDIKPQGSKNVYRFRYHRPFEQKPSQTLSHMTDELGSVWWSNKKRTGKRYQASQHVFERAIKKNIPPNSVIPIEIKSPVRIKKFLSSLKLTTDDLQSHQAKKTVKSAYRKAAFKHHPDRGGDSDSFRKVTIAYQELTHWLQSPALRLRRGIPGRWCFDGNTWKTPLLFFNN